MVSSFETDGLNELLKDFYTVVGIRISVFDDEFEIVTEYPREMPEVCRLIRRTKAGADACRKCDMDACKRAKRLGGPHVYTCHAGITEAITPLKLGGGVIGYAIFAHMMPEENYDEAVDEVCRRCAAYGTEEEIRNAVTKISTRSREKIIAALKILDAIASYMQISKLATWKNEDVSKQIDTFIDKNLKEDLDSEALCRHFFISRTKLYQLSMQSFGMGIAKYISHKRIERAKDLLREGNLTVTEIAREVGVDDYNYFCKIFRKAVGMPPGKYRHQVTSFISRK